MDSANPRPVSAKPCTEPGHTALVSAWCQTCQTFVCIQGMVSEKHAGHIFISLEKRAGEFGARIEQKKIELRKIEESFGADLVQQLEIETKFNARVDDLNNEIDKRSQRLHSEIESWKTKTKSTLQTRVKEIRISMKVSQDQIKEDQNKLRAALEQCSLENYKADEAIQVKRQSSVYIPACLILTEVNTSMLDMDTLLGHISDEESYGSDYVSYTKPFSSTGSDDTSDLHGLSDTERNFMEELKNERIYCDLQVHDVEILKHCQFKNPNQQDEEIKLAASRDGGIWVTSTGQRCIKHFDDEGNSRRKVLTDFDIYDIDVNSRNELFASVHNGFKIKKKTYFNWKTLVRTEHRVTFGIGITSADDVLVCLQGMDYAEIVKFSPTGNSLQSIRLDEDQKEIFHRPRKVLEVEPTGDVLVVDDKTLITLNTEEEVKKTWRGELDSDTGKEDTVVKFQPVSIAVSSEGDLFILDQGNKQIAVFDKTGQPFWNMHDTVMLNDMSCAVFDAKDQFWVACRDGAIHQSQLRFHRTNNSDEDHLDQII